MFEDKIRVARKGFEPVDLTVSFRSTPAVLDAVDWVFGQDAAAAAWRRPGEVNHQHSRKQDPGRVELWPLVAAEKVETDTDRRRGAGRRADARRTSGWRG